jgi:Ca2+:H+ antiporter
LALKRKMNQALAITIGSSIQISLFVTPFLVVMGWFMDKPMSLSKHYSFLC